MTRIYFVRHAQSLHPWENDRTRPLTEDGKNDSKKVTEVLKNLPIDAFYSSPYKRSVDTIKESADFFGMKILKDERMRERKTGINGYSNRELVERRWADFKFCEENGENLDSVQKRNIETLFEILDKEKGKNVVIGTHGTALSTMLHYFNNSWGCKGFFRIIDYMPYIIRLDFVGTKLIEKEELLIIEKEFKGTTLSDKVKIL